MTLFFMLVFAIPPASVDIPGFGVINYLIELNHIRILTVCVLLPTALTLSKQGDTVRFGRLWPDKLLAASLVLMTLLYLRETTVTDTLRQAVSLYIDVFLPYYVASRGLK